MRPSESAPNRATVHTSALVDMLRNPAPLRATGWRPTTNPALVWRWVIVDERGPIIERRNGTASSTCALDDLRQLAEHGDAEARSVFVQVIGGSLQPARVTR